MFPLYPYKFLMYIIFSIGAATLLFFLVASFSDPGFNKKSKDVKFSRLIEVVSPILVCPDCQIVKT